MVNQTPVKAGGFKSSAESADTGQRPVNAIVNAHVNEKWHIMLDHEKLDVYKVSIEFMPIAIKIADNIPR